MAGDDPQSNDKPSVGLRNPKPEACPRSADIERMLLSLSSEAQTEELAAHLDGCAACRQVAEAVAKQADLEHDLNRAADVQAKTHVDVSVPLARLNELLSDYEVLGEIGRGGMGIVYRARQLKLNRVVALKVLPALLGVVRPDAIARFRREAELAAALEHTNIIGVYDFGEVDGTLYYAMQLIEGRSLRDILREINDTGAIDVVLGAVSDQPSAISQKEEATGQGGNKAATDSDGLAFRNPKSDIPP